MTDIVRRVYVDSYALKPRVRVSADTIVYGSAPQSQAGGWAGTRTYAEVLQDWVGWMREGILDLNVPMDYKRDPDAAQRRQYSEWGEYAKEQQYGRQAAIGGALYLNDIASSVRQVRAAVATGAVSGRSSAGWVGYSYRNPDDASAAGSRAGAATAWASVGTINRAALSPPSATPSPRPGFSRFHT